MVVEPAVQANVKMVRRMSKRIVVKKERRGSGNENGLRRRVRECGLVEVKGNLEDGSGWEKATYGDEEVNEKPELPSTSVSFLIFTLSTQARVTTIIWLIHLYIKTGPLININTNQLSHSV